VRFVLGLSLAFWACRPASPSASLEPWEKKWEPKSETRRGNLFIYCEPEDADILLDGIPQGNCLDYATHGLQIKESATLRKIVVTKTGYWPYEAMVVFNNSKVSLRVQLQAEPTSVRP